MARNRSKAASAPVDAGVHYIETTMRPGEVIEVGDAEHLDLTRQGVVLKEHGADTKAAAGATVIESGAITDPQLDDEGDDDDLEQNGGQE